MICLVTLEQVHDPAPAWVGNVTGRQVEIYAEGESHMQCEVYAAKAAEIALGGTWESLACYQLDRDRVPDIPEGQGIVGERNGDINIRLETAPELLEIRRHDKCSCPECDKSASIGDRCHLCHELNCMDDWPKCNTGGVVMSD